MKNLKEGLKMTSMNTDLLDEYCMKLYGHTDWYQTSYDNENEIHIVFPKEARDD